MTFQKKLSPAEERKLLIDYQDGWTIKELTIIYRVSTRTIFRILAANHVPRVRRNPGRSRQRVRQGEKRNRLVAGKELQPCGTNAAYARHNKAGEYPCPACLEAHSIEQKKYRVSPSDWPEPEDDILKLKTRRIERGLSKVALSKLIGVSDTTLYYWEGGARRPSNEMLELWKRVLR